MSYNKVILFGHLAKDITVKYSQNGKVIARSSIAVTKRFKTSSGEQKEETLFIDISFFSRLGELASEYLRKGSKLLIDGRLVLDQWVDKDGNHRSKHSVAVENMQMLDTKKE